MARRKFIVGNWKMNGRLTGALNLCQDILNGLGDGHNCDIAIAPPFPLIAPIAGAFHNTALHIAAQNCHHQDEGAFTGEVSAPMLYDAGARWVILGHSERRDYFQENDALIYEKANQAWQEKLNVILCVGETKEEREADKTLSVIETQLTPYLQAETAPARLTIAYEPVWAIGTGLVASTEEADAVHIYIRKRFHEEWGKNYADNLRILYGGSMKPNNAPELLAKNDIDGGLIGGASLKAQDFLGIIKSCPVKDN